MAHAQRPDAPIPPDVNAGRGRLDRLRDMTGRPDLVLLAVALLLALLSWPLADIEPDPGLDGSWTTALHRASSEHLGFGSETVFSFGPLGFLREPVLAYPWTTRLAFGYVLVLQFALCLALLWALRRNFGSLLVAALLTLLIAALVEGEPATVLAFAVAVGLVHGDVPSRWVPSAALSLGALAGVQLLAKISTGIAVAALCAIALAALGADRRRTVAWFAGGLVSALVAGWALTGQGPADVVAFLGASLQVVGGYSEAMRLEDPTGAWELWAAALLAGVGFAVILRGDPLIDDRTRLVTAALWTVLAFTAYKSAFVRHDTGHATFFFATSLGGLAVLPLTRLPRSTAALVLLLAGVALFGSARLDPADAVDPVTRAEAFLDQAAILADPSETNAHIVAARERQAAAYQLDPATFDHLAGHTVHVEPYETSVTWAYRLEWKPPPVFQSYTAFTADLDDRNARALAAPDGPDRILRHNLPAIDGRNRTWESPSAMRAILCHFRALSTTAQWQVLGRVPNRCGAPRLLAERSGDWGEDIAIPPAPNRRSAVYAEVDGLAVHGAERLVNVLYRAAPRAVVLDGGREYRLVPDTAQNGLLLRVPRKRDMPAPFGLDQASERMTLLRRGASGDGPSVRFYAVTLGP